MMLFLSLLPAAFVDSIYDHACIVEMKTLEDAERACERLHDRKFDGTYVGIKVRRKIPFLSLPFYIHILTLKY